MKIKNYLNKAAFHTSLARFKQAVYRWVHPEASDNHAGIHMYTEGYMQYGGIYGLLSSYSHIERRPCSAVRHYDYKAYAVSERR